MPGKPQVTSHASAAHPPASVHRPPVHGNRINERRNLMSYGLTAAAAWGISSIAAMQAARRIGVYLAILFSQLLGAAALAPLAAASHTGFSEAGLPLLAGLAAGGLLGLAAWWAYYTALGTGPLGTVSAIAASYGAVTAALSVLILHEHVTPAAAAGIIAATAGVTLIARPARRRPARHARPKTGTRPARQGPS
jgi:drug/metabolite transporter (DMT)-like permease